MTKKILKIPGWHPTRLNVLLHAHWSQRGRLKRHDRDLITVYALQAGIPKAQGKRRVSLVLTLGPRQRGGDPDAYFKSGLDALVAVGLLVDDSPRWCELGTVTFERGEQQSTTILLEDLEPARPKRKPLKRGPALGRIRVCHDR